MDRSNTEAVQDHPDRLLVFLNSFYPADSPQIRAITDSPALATATPAIRVPGTAIHSNISFRVLIESFDLEHALWRPTIIEGSHRSVSGKPGLIISENAAIDLDVGVGDTITLEHPRRAGLFAYEIIPTEVEVVGLHPDPWRNFMYIDIADADLFGITGMTNLLHVDPAANLSPSEAKRAMFEFPTVSSVITIYDLLEANQTVLNEVTVFLGGVKFGVLALAFLIALNSTNINLSERSREIATMFAFGLPPRTVARMAMIENLIVGVFGTLIGFGLGALILVWFTQTRMPQILPEVRFPITVSASTISLAIVVGVVVVALTPLLTIHKMMDMDVPDTLRVME
jgi:putative ABC transport system permease protein